MPTGARGSVFNPTLFQSHSGLINTFEIAASGKAQTLSIFLHEIRSVMKSFRLIRLLKVTIDLKYSSRIRF